MTVVLYVGPPVGGVPWPPAPGPRPRPSATSEHRTEERRSGVDSKRGLSFACSGAGLDALGLQFSRIKKDGTNQHVFDFEKKNWVDQSV